LKNQKAAEFAYNTNLTGHLIDMDYTNKNCKKLENDTKLNLNPYNANAYDALCLAVLIENFHRTWIL
jgi:hypothetical protein